MDHGFTLVEIAIVVLVLGLLLASLLGPLSVRIEQQEIRKTAEQMEEIKEALYGYAMDKEALPCPAADDDGRAEDCCATTPTCTGPADPEGWVPWQTLGLERGDAWGFLFRYRVTPVFTVPDDDGICDPDDGDVPAKADLDLCDGGDITVKSRGYDKPASPGNLVTQIPAIIVSHGKNGRGATPALGGPAIPGPGATAADELENLDGDKIFLTRHYTTDDPTCDDNDTSKSYCGFDDIVVWISANVLKYRLVQAGRLP